MSRHRSAESGRLGEQLAAEEYRRSGYTLLEQNYRTRYGEVDLILERGGQLVFCEVKTRGDGALARPAAWVDARKQKKLLSTAAIYLQQCGLGDPPLRFDVAEVYTGDAPPRVVLIENAFEII